MFIHFIGTWWPYSYVYVSKAITIVYSYVFQVIDVLSKLAGLWVNSKNEIMYSQASQITFICPMIFNYFPLDTQVRKKPSRWIRMHQNTSSSRHLFLLTFYDYASLCMFFFLAAFSFLDLPLHLWIAEVYLC